MSIAKQQLTILHIPDKYLCAKLPPPKSMKIELVPRCNYKCKYCSYPTRKVQPTSDMDWLLFKKITKEARQLGVEEIGVFYIGESFMNHRLLVKAIKYLKQKLKYPYVFITTNGSLASPDKVEACMKEGLDSLKWSCNMADEKQFEHLAGASSKCFNLLKQNIKSAFNIRKEKGYKTTLSASSVKYDEEQLEKMKPFIEEIKPYVDEHYWLPLYSAGGAEKKKEKELGMKPIAGNTGRLDNPSEPLPCWTAFTSAHVLYDGRLSACCLDGTGGWIMGDLKTQSLMEAWNSEKFVKLRKKHLAKDVTGTICQKCILFE